MVDGIHAAGMANKPPRAPCEDGGRLNLAIFHAPSERHHFMDSALPLRCCAQIDNQIDSTCNRWNDEARADVLPREEWKRAEFRHRFSSAVCVQCREAWLATVQRNEHVKRLSLSDLTDDKAVGAHAQRLLHEPAQWNLTCSLERWAARLHRDPIGMPQFEFEHFFAGDDALVRGNG